MARNLTSNISETVRDTEKNGILTGTYTRPTRRCHFEWAWVTSAKYLMIRSMARFLCESWASCYSMSATRQRKN